VPKGLMVAQQERNQANGQGRAGRLLWGCLGLAVLGGLGSLGYGLYRIVTLGVEEVGVMLLMIGGAVIFGALYLARRWVYADAP